MQANAEADRRLPAGIFDGAVASDSQKRRYALPLSLRFSAKTRTNQGSRLAGDYGGVSAGATVGVGLGANVLVGGLDRSIALQPVSVEGNTGLALAAGVGVITLREG